MLVDRLRQMIGATATEYTIGATAYWTDSQLQQTLDGHVSARLVQAPVEVYSTIVAGGIVEKDGRIPARGTLDLDTLVICDLTGHEYDPGDFEAFDDGRITFTESQISAGPLASGLAYDLNAAAAAVLRDWAAAIKLGYDVETDGTSMSRSQRHRQMLAQAETFASKALPGTIKLANGPVSRRSRLLRSFDRIGRY
jgi:hypothetical protein